MKKEKQENCIICLEIIKNLQKIWYCLNCNITTHSLCAISWQKKLLSKKKKFNCPHCLKNYENTKNFCFCKKTENPLYNKNLEKNSCGEICDKKKKCNHKCEKICHIGNCFLRCEKKSYFYCFCKKKLFFEKCEEITKKNCGEICNKILNCKNHRCERICHIGDCEKCDEKKDIFCFCGKYFEIMNCGEILSCDEICGKKLKCGNHLCKKKCHLGNCEECPNKIKKDEKCDCGKMLIKKILNRERKNCLEKKPNCKKKCGNILECGDKCEKICHLDKCRCYIKKIKKCNCGLKTEKLFCYEKIKNCENICKIKKTCKSHICLKKCCSKNKHDHKCYEICKKIKNCKKHNCFQNCHKGKCDPCDVFLSHPIFCNCKNKKIEPPLICGTEIEKCYKKCNKEIFCGHKCYYYCHFGNCPKCEEILDKPCNCGKTIKKDIKCSKIPKCRLYCDGILKCGHFCNLICHKREHCYRIRETSFEKFSGCFEKCGKMRKCEHLCIEKCHFGRDCEGFRCEEKVFLFCICGENKKKVFCYEYDNFFKNENDLKNDDSEIDNKKVFFFENKKKFKNDFENEINFENKNKNFFEEGKYLKKDDCEILDEKKKIEENVNQNNINKKFIVECNIICKRKKKF